MSRTTPTNRQRHIVIIKAAVITALVLAGAIGVYFLIRAIVAMHS